MLDRRVWQTQKVAPNSVEWPLFEPFDGWVQERHNSIADTLELRLSCTNPSHWWLVYSCIFARLQWVNDWIKNGSWLGVRAPATIIRTAEPMLTSVPSLTGRVRLNEEILSTRDGMAEFQAVLLNCSQLSWLMSLVFCESTVKSLV